MGNTRIIIYNGDGTIGILIPAPNSKLTIEQIIAKDVPNRKSHRVTDVTKIPSDSYFRMAWTDDNSTDIIDVDMTRAKVIHMNSIRFQRDKELVELDIEQLKGNDVSTQKQILRDIPETFDLSGAATPDELKALWPSELSLIEEL